MNGATTTHIHLISLEFDFKTNLPFFGPSTSDYTNLTNDARWKKWSWLDDALSLPFYATTVTTLKIVIRVFHSPPTQSSETAFEVQEFTTSVTRVLQDTLPLLSEKGKVNVQCWVLPLL
jgi:hypothetical protein